ncbi:phenylalanyl-tRNA synthetase beta chain, putative [Eimeria tenella]|uniref:phenylalanine--tRNA ligase n=1 Tax=Eimeria tenella TaxID=5802 RepID=U6KKR3_EIMTE|nr:phenylalanyl-tRNA synthetase beta chain, putative [Eimeria tenella]CDJ38514.1 phenylalanyl-tRNA synthetase beta chain, putative [Eimeria tenella]|eukprot:XP_013229352.1 phenylalanyl-tRNA synthetase beta chain, putative [Eimeria tenella]
MPTVPVVAEELYERLGRIYTDDELNSLCFAFGVELDEVVELEGQKTLKIDVPANRYDLLCVEGLGRALKVFTAKDPLGSIPSLRLSGPPKITLHVKASAQGPRPFIACAALRGVRLNPRRLQSCIELQEKLHHTLCRRRTLVSIGTYDLALLQPPFSYGAYPPQEVFFQPLGCSELPPMKGPQILTHFAAHPQLKHFVSFCVSVVAVSRAAHLLHFAAAAACFCSLGLLPPSLCGPVGCPLALAAAAAAAAARAAAAEGAGLGGVADSCELPLLLLLLLQQYLHMLEGQPRLYLLKDSKGQVLSMPPLINAEGCKLTADSRDIFIDCTSVEENKGQVALNTVVAMLAEYCEEPFAVEPVRVVYEAEGRELVTPCLDMREMKVQMSTVRRICGLQNLAAAEAAQQLHRLMLPARPDPHDERDSLLVSVPPTRTDVMHEVDVAEDVAIGIGFETIPRTVAPKLACNPRSLLKQSLRTLLVSLGFTECLTFALCSQEENAEALKKPLYHPHQPTPAFDPLEHQWGGMPVLLSNAKTRELTETRTQLLSGLLKSLATNIGRREMPIRLFEIGDVVIRDDRTETGSRNLLYCSAAFADEHGSGLEEVHGLLDAALEAMGLIGDYVVAERQAAVAAGREEQQEALKTFENMRIFSLKPTQLPTFLPGRQVEISVSRRTFKERGATFKRTEAAAEQQQQQQQQTNGASHAADPDCLTLGHMGTLHVDCLRAFGLAVPVSLVEFTLEPFLHWLPETDLIFA